MASSPADIYLRDSIACETLKQVCLIPSFPIDLYNNIFFVSLQGSSGSSSEKGYICDSDSDGDKVSLNYQLFYSKGKLRKRRKGGGTKRRRRRVSYDYSLFFALSLLVQLLTTDQSNSLWSCFFASSISFLSHQPLVGHWKMAWQLACTRRIKHAGLILLNSIHFHV